MQTSTRQIRVTTISRVMAAILVMAPAVHSAQTAAPPPVEQQIAAAVQPLPADMRAAATVMGYRTGNKLEVIRPGTNGMRCLALYVSRPDFHVACYHDGLEPFMARGRELREQGITNMNKVDSARTAEITSGKLKMPAQGALYTLTAAEKSAWDPATAKITGARPLTVLYIPFATTATTGIPSTPIPNGPWLMNPGTAKAHVMIVGTMGQ
jgi:hypothetical protein